MSCAGNNDEDYEALAGTTDAADDRQGAADEMSSSTTALTQTLYLTVLDVFGGRTDGDDGDDDDPDREYDRMLATLRDRQARRRAAAEATSTPSHAAPADAAAEHALRGEGGVLATKLRAGYLLEPGRVCDEGVMPMMTHQGRVSCVVCDAGEETLPSGEQQASADGAEIEADATHAPGHDDEDDEDAEDAEERLVQRELSRYHER